MTPREVEVVITPSEAQAADSERLVLDPDDAAQLYNLAAMWFACAYGEEAGCVCDNCHLRRWFHDHGMSQNPLLTGKPFRFSQSVADEGA